MRVLVYSSRPYDQNFMEAANQGRHELHFTEARLVVQSARMAEGFEAVCCFVSDRVDAEVLQQLHDGGTKLVVLRSTGFNNVDLDAAERLGIAVMRVSNYSPYAVAEFTVGMILAMNRKIHRAHLRIDATKTS